MAFVDVIAIRHRVYHTNRRSESEKRRDGKQTFRGKVPSYKYSKQGNQKKTKNKKNKNDDAHIGRVVVDGQHFAATGRVIVAAAVPAARHCRGKVNGGHQNHDIADDEQPHA